MVCGIKIAPETRYAMRSLGKCAAIRVRTTPKWTLCQQLKQRGLLTAAVPRPYLAISKALPKKRNFPIGSRATNSVAIHPVRTRVTMTTDMTGTGRQSLTGAGHFNKLTEFYPYVGRCASSNAGMTGSSSNRKWGRHLGTVLLLTTGTIAAWAAYKVCGFGKRDFVPFESRHFSDALGTWGTYKGVTIFFSLLEGIERARDFKVRPDDIFVASFPRSGTTWTQETVYLICNHADEQKAKSATIQDRFPYLEDSVGSIELLDKMESPRFIKTHLPYHLLPSEFNKKKPKMIYVMRNPKDVVVSDYHLWRKFNDVFHGGFADYCELFIQDKVAYTPWVEHVKGYWERRDDENVLFIMYEDLITNYKQEVLRISKFLKKPLGDEEMAKILNHCSFQSMKHNDMVNHKWLDERGLTSDIGTSFMRKGKVGDWKNYFTPELDQRLMEKVERPLEAIGLKVKYEVELEDSKNSKTS